MNEQTTGDESEQQPKSEKWGDPIDQMRKQELWVLVRACCSQMRPALPNPMHAS